MRKFLLLFTALLLCGCAYNVTESESIPTEPVFQNETVTKTEPTTEPDLSISVPAGSHRCRFTDEITEQYLDYYLFVPENAVKGMPLVIFLHGDGEVNQIEKLENFGLIARAREIYGENFPFIAISPCTRSYSWIKDPIPETLKSLIDTISAECETDPQRIIITGHSRGAIGTWHMVNLYGDYFSAAVPVSCGYAAKFDNDKIKSVPIRAMAGSRDTYLREVQSASDRVSQFGGNVEFVNIEDCTHGEASSKAFTIETFTWMLEQ